MHIAVCDYSEVEYYVDVLDQPRHFSSSRPYQIYDPTNLNKFTIFTQLTSFSIMLLTNDLWVRAKPATDNFNPQPQIAFKLSQLRAQLARIRPEPPEEKRSEKRMDFSQALHLNCKHKRVLIAIFFFSNKFLFSRFGKIIWMFAIAKSLCLNMFKGYLTVPMSRKLAFVIRNTNPNYLLVLFHQELKRLQVGKFVVKLSSFSRPRKADLNSPCYNISPLS